MPSRLLSGILVLSLIATATVALADSDGTCPIDPALQGGSGLADLQPILSFAGNPAEQATADLQKQLTSPPLAQYYADGVRVEACWANPAGSKLTDLQKAFYCSMPLEFRLCNTVVLLSIKDESNVDGRYQGYLNCQKTIDAATGGTGAYLYPEVVNQTYQDLFLRQQSGLTDAQAAQLIAERRPVPSGRSFPSLLGGVIAGLAPEVVEVGSADFRKMVDQALKGEIPPV